MRIRVKDRERKRKRKKEREKKERKTLNGQEGRIERQGRKRKGNEIMVENMKEKRDSRRKREK